jgi:FMN phosphatase YigB (HAD superfamily)
MKTRFVYFDLGNVLACFSLERLLRQVADVVGYSHDKIKIAYFEANGLQQRLERGDIGTDEYYARICDRIGKRPERDTFFHAISDIFWVNERMEPYLTALAAMDFPRGILSNTGPHHWGFCTRSFPGITEKIPANHILSYEVRELKPNRGIYEAAISKAKTAVPDIVPGEILFLDDLQQNVQGAVDCGIDAVLYNDQTDLTAVLAERIPGFVAYDIDV